MPDWLLVVLLFVGIEAVFALGLWLVCLLAPGDLEAFDREFR